MKTFSRISILIFFIFTKTLFSQSYFSLLDSAYNSNIFSTVLNNNLNSANLNSRLFYTNEIGKFKFTVLNDYNSDLTKLDKKGYIALKDWIVKIPKLFDNLEIFLLKYKL